jgi:stage II sporulation protein D
MLHIWPPGTYHRGSMPRRLAAAIFVSILVALPALAAGYFRLPAEPLIRIGLATNASAVTITTADSQLVAFSPDEPQRMLATNRVTVSARSYRPPEIDVFRFEIRSIATAVEASEIAIQIREETGEPASVSIDTLTSTWTIEIGTPKESIEEAAAFKAMLDEKGIQDAVMTAERRLRPSRDAVALSHQVRSAGKSEVRSLIRPTGDVQPALGDAVAAGLREVIVSGASEQARYASLKAVSFGSFDERANPVRLNGKAYRGKLEVFVNARGTLTVVNVVPLEEYLLGVVPAELSLPQLEAQKAQAIAARTYAVANIDGYGAKGFDMVPTVWSQVYKGVAIETRMGTQAVRETRGIVATYGGKPIMAYFTSTCGGRTENSENIFDHAEPYLRGVECSIEGPRHFEPFMVRTSRQPAKVRSDENLELVRLISMLSAGGFSPPQARVDDDWFDEMPTVPELSNWLGQLAMRFGKPLPPVSKDTAFPLGLARVLAGFLYTTGAPDTLMTDSDISYHLSFDDSSEVPLDRRAELAALIRDGYFVLHPDLTLKPGKAISRARMLRLIRQIYEKRKWMPAPQSGTARPSVDGKLVLRSGKADRQLAVRSDVFLFRQFGTSMYPVKEAAIMGGENVRFITDGAGAVAYLEIEPTPQPTAAENMSPFTNWSTSLSASAVQARLSRYVRGIGTLYDVNIKRQGYSRRAVELEIVGSNGVKTLKGGKIRSALRLREQLFVIDKRYAGAQAVSFTFTGRGWGHGVGMCQYGAYGMAKMGIKANEIIRHYYTGAELTKAY